MYKNYHDIPDGVPTTTGDYITSNGGWVPNVKNNGGKSVRGISPGYKGTTPYRQKIGPQYTQFLTKNK